MSLANDYERDLLLNFLTLKQRSKLPNELLKNIIYDYFYDPKRRSPKFEIYFHA